MINDFNDMGLFIFNPFGVGACPIPKPTGSTCGYSYSTPTGLGPFSGHPLGCTLIVRHKFLSIDISMT